MYVLRGTPRGRSSPSRAPWCRRRIELGPPPGCLTRSQGGWHRCRGAPTGLTPWVLCTDTSCHPTQGSQSFSPIARGERGTQEGLGVGDPGPSSGSSGCASAAAPSTVPGWGGGGGFIELFPQLGEGCFQMTPAEEWVLGTWSGCLVQLCLTLVDSGLASLAPSFPSPYNEKSKGLAQGLGAEDQAAEGRTRGGGGVPITLWGTGRVIPGATS